MLTGKQEMFSKYMFTPGSETFGNGTESARKAGHKGTDNYLARVASENVRKCKITAEKAKIQAETAKELDITKEGQHKKLQKAFDIAETTKNPSAMTGAVREQNEMCGFHQDKAPNSEAEAAKLARMSAEEREYREAWERERCRQEAIKPVRSA